MAGFINRGKAEYEQEQKRKQAAAAALTAFLPKALQKNALQPVAKGPVVKKSSSSGSGGSKPKAGSGAKSKTPAAKNQPGLAPLPSLESLMAALDGMREKRQVPAPAKKTAPSALDIRSRYDKPKTTTRQIEDHVTAAEKKRRSQEIDRITQQAFQKHKRKSSGLLGRNPLEQETAWAKALAARGNAATGARNAEETVSTGNLNQTSRPQTVLPTATGPGRIIFPDGKSVALPQMNTLADVVQKAQGMGPLASKGQQGAVLWALPDGTLRNIAKDREAAHTVGTAPQGGEIADGVQLALDAAGLVPGVGEAADFINVLISLARGNYGDAALSATAMIPFAGWGATVGKGAKHVSKAADAMEGAAKAADVTTTGIRPQFVLPTAMDPGYMVLPNGKTVALDSLIALPPAAGKKVGADPQITVRNAAFPGGSGMRNANTEDITKDFIRESLPERLRKNSDGDIIGGRKESGLEGAGSKTGKFIDNTTDSITKGEKQVVDDLVGKGKTVERIPKDPNNQTPDFKVDGIKTELKTLQNPNTNTGMKRIQEGFEQGAETVIIDARGSGATADLAREIISRAKGKYSGGNIPGKVEIWIDGQVITYP